MWARVILGILEITMNKRVWLMAGLLCLSLVPVAAWAEDVPATEPSEEMVATESREPEVAPSVEVSPSDDDALPLEEPAGSTEALEAVDTPESVDLPEPAEDSEAMGAVEEQEPLGAVTYAPVTVLKGTPSDNWNLQDLPDMTSIDGTWTVRSYLAETSRGLMRVGCKDKSVIIEYYNTSGEVNQRKTIAYGSNEKFGGFFAGSDGSFYLVFGTYLSERSTPEESVRVEHYDSSWNKIKSCIIRDRTTLVPFSASSLRMTEANGVLYIDTSHRIYSGFRSTLYAIKESSMTLIDTDEGGGSCNQFLRADSETLFRVTQSDYNSPALSEIPLSGWLGNYDNTRDLIKYDVMGSDTPSVGGFELSNEGYLVAWSGRDSYASWGSNIHVSFTSSSQSQEGVTNRITLFEKGTSKVVCTPQLVKLDGDAFLLMWVEEENNTYRMGLTRVDGSGDLSTDITYKTLPASDCQPIMLASGQVAWYVSTDDEVVLYTLDPWNLSDAPEDNIGGKLQSKWKRVAGGDRYGTMEAIVKQSRPKKSASTILLATGAGYADALTSSALAGALDAPLVTTKPTELSPQAKRAIEYASNGSATVLVIGGPAAVSNKAVDAVKALPCVKTVRRVAGSNRIGTGMAIYNEGKSRKLWGDTCVVTNAFNYKDALSIGSWAAVAKAPLFGTSGGKLNAQQVAAIKAGGFKRVVVLGGDKAVNYAAVRQALGSSFAYTRLWGANGLATSAKIVNWACGYTKVGGEVAFQPSAKVKLDGMGVATATGFADALTSVSLLSRTKGALLLVQYQDYGPPGYKNGNKTTYKNIRSVIVARQRSIQQGYILGGERAVDPEVQAMLQGTVYPGYE